MAVDTAICCSGDAFPSGRLWHVFFAFAPYLHPVSEFILDLIILYSYIHQLYIRNLNQQLYTDTMTDIMVAQMIGTLGCGYVAGARFLIRISIARANKP